MADSLTSGVQGQEICLFCASMESDVHPKAKDNGSGKEKREKRRKIRQLQSAIRDNDMDTVKDLLLIPFDVDFQYDSQTSLQLAVCQGRIEICRMLIKKDADVNQADAEGNSLLNMACWRGFVDIAQLLVDSGADIDVQNESGNTCLNVCAHKGNEDIACILLKAGCNANLSNNRGLNPLHTVCLSGCLGVVKHLLAHGADTDWIDCSGRTPLMMAAAHGHTHVVKALLDAGVSINMQCRLGRTAVYEATVTGQLEVVKDLVHHGVDLNLCTTKGSTPLLEAVVKDHEAIADLLIKNGCDVNLSDRSSEAPIHALIRQIASVFKDDGDGDERYTLFYTLVEVGGADVNKRDAEGRTPLYQALEAADIVLCKYLFSKKASVNSVTVTGNTVLHAAVFGGCQEAVRLCLDSGCAVNTVNKSNQHALLSAVSSRCNIEILKMLLEAGSEVNIAQAYDKHTALHEAVCQHYEAAAGLLIQYGSDLTMVNREKKSALFLACKRGLTDTARLLLSQPSCPRSSPVCSALPIHAAATHGRSGCIMVLAEYGCDLNELNEKGMTPLMTALDEDSFSSARALLQCGCDLEYQQKLVGLQICCLKQDDDHPHIGLEPIFLAMTHKNMDMMRMLFKCYRQIPRKTIHMIGLLLAKTEGLNVHYNKEQKREILSMFSQNIRTTFSLTDACRRSIRARLGSPLQAKVEALPVGDKMKRFILMEEEFESWKELEQDKPGGSSGFSDLFVKKDSW